MPLLPAPPATVTAPAPPSRLRVVVMALLALAAGAGVSHWLETTGTVSYSATLQAHTTRITADRAGRIDKLIAAAGQSVVPGTPLLQLADQQHAERILAKQREIRLRKAELARAEAQAQTELAWRSREIEREIFETQVQSAEYLQQRYARRLEQIAWHDYLSGRETFVSTSFTDDAFRALAPESRLPDEKRIQALINHESATSASEALATQIQFCEKRLEELNRLRQSLPASVRRSTGVGLAEERLEAAEAELHELLIEQQALTITSPVYGTVGVFRRTVGDPIEAAETLVEILDEDRRCLLVAVPSDEIGRFRAGMEVQLRFPGERDYEGRVAEVPPQTDRGDDRHGTPTVHVRVEPSGKVWPRVPIGSQVTVLLHR